MNPAPQFGSVPVGPGVLGAALGLFVDGDDDGEVGARDGVVLGAVVVGLNVAYS